MTVICLASVKGSPGVTTLAVLLARRWPPGRRAVVVEWDPAGGDLAARHCLSSRRGWVSLSASWRRPGPPTTLASHLQEADGGVRVLVAPPPVEGVVPSLPLERLDAAASGDPQGPFDLLVDAGRLGPHLRLPAAVGRGTASGADREGEADDTGTRLVVLVRNEPSAALHVRDRLRAPAVFGARRVGLVVVGRGPHAADEIEEFTGVPVVAVLPSALDRPGADGGRLGRRRRARSIGTELRPLVRALTAGGAASAAAIDEAAPDATVAG